MHAFQGLLLYIFGLHSTAFGGDLSLVTPVTRHLPTRHTCLMRPQHGWVIGLSRVMWPVPQVEKLTSLLVNSS